MSKRLTIQDFNNTLGIENSYDIMNAIRNTASPQFQQYVPLANAENIAQVGAGLLVNQNIQNEFIISLVDRIALFVLHSKVMTNILGKFKRGTIPLGSRIEETYIDLVPEQAYDPDGAESTVFKREIPDVKTLFHEINRQSFYKQTIQDASLQKAFVSWGDFDRFVSGTIQAMYNSNQVDEFKYMKLLIDSYASKGYFKVQPILPVTDEATGKDFIKKARAITTLMTLPTGSRNYNSLAVHTTTDMSDLHFIVDAELLATVDVDVLARAFNIDKTNFIGQVTTIDNFATPGLRAIAVDREWFMVYDNIFKMESIRNPQGMYWNYNLHAWQIMSTSRFANAVAFIEDTGTNIPPVSSVIVSPSIAGVKKGATKQFDAVVRANDDEAHTITWSVSTATGTPNVGTTVNSDGLLTVASAETAQQLLVTASVTYDTGEVDEDDNPITVTVKGEAIVLVK